MRTPAEQETVRDLIAGWDDIPLWAGVMLLPDGFVLLAAVPPKAH